MEFAGKKVRVAIVAGLALLCCAAAPKPKKGGKEEKKPDAPPASAPAPTVDPFGVTMLNATKKNGRTWFAKWTAARALKKGQTDPRTPSSRTAGPARSTSRGEGSRSRAAR